MTTLEPEGPTISDSAQPALAASSAKRLSPRRLAMRRFARNRAAVASSVVLALIVIMAIIGPIIAGHAPTSIDLSSIRKPPSGEHWFGTDSTGRDVFARLWSGARVSIGIGLVAALLSVALGGVLGAMAGVLRGVVESVIMRLTDMSLAMPGIILIIVLAGILGPTIPILIIGIVVTSWDKSCRVAHSVTLAIREREYVQVSVGSGARTWWLLRKHILPDALPPLIVTVTLAIAGAILTEAALSFLGLGVQPPSASWGNMLNDAQSLTLIRTAPWLWIFPGTAIAVTVLAVNFIGDGVRDAFDPRQAIGS